MWTCPPPEDLFYDMRLLGCEKKRLARLCFRGVRLAMVSHDGNQHDERMRMNPVEQRYWRKNLLVCDRFSTKL